MATTMDLLPTIAYLAGGNLPTDRKLDGHNIIDLMNGKSTKSPYDVFYYYQLEQLQAIRSGSWKLHLPLDSMYGNIHTAQIVAGRPVALYNLENDIAEANDLASQFPDIVYKLMVEAEKARVDLGDFGIAGKGIRPAAIIENPVPQLMN